MARITIHDCLEKIENPFTLVQAASRRARALAMGAPSLLPKNQHKPTVNALREIAEGLLDETGKMTAISQEKNSKTSQNEEDIQAEIEDSRMMDEGDIAPASDEANDLHGEHNPTDE